MCAAIADMWRIGWKQGAGVTRSSAHLGNERGFLSQNSKVTDRNIRVSVIT